MQVPNFLTMMGNHRHLIFRVSIVFNIAVFLYAAVHYSGNSAQGVDWVPLTSDGSEASNVYKYREEVRNETARIFAEYTSQKMIPSTTATAKKTAPSTTSTVASVTAEVQNYDDNVLPESTLAFLRAILKCNNKAYLPDTVQRGEFWVLQNYVRADHGPLACHETITYTTHGGFDFLDNLVPLVKRWLAPVSLAVHAPGTDMQPTVDSIRYLRDCMGTDVIRKYVTFHVFFSNKHIPISIPKPEEVLQTRINCSAPPPYAVNSSTTYKQMKSMLYPINVARNIARSAALTHFVLPSDIELYPSPKLVPKFLNMIARNEEPLKSSKRPRVFPLSLFEVDINHTPPRTKNELRRMLVNKTAIPFHKYVCPMCHNMPRGKEWAAKREERYMKVFHVAKRQAKHSHWEPIFIGTNNDPFYDERLSWEGKQDKMTHGFILCVKDYDFMILNNGFLVHKPGIKHIKKNPQRERIAGKQSSYIRHIIFPELKKLFGEKKGCSL